ncbi:MAG: benzoate-CoA ligase family protein [Thermoguttaceae bacterium]|jgi:benzoate-CoA ligase family protein
MTELNLPERLNAAEVFVDRHLDLGREQKAAILYGDEQVSYGRLHENVNRMGNLLRQLGVRIEERVAILLPDSPEWVYAFYGSIKIGAVAVPMNTMLTSPDYEYLLNDSRARVLIVDAGLKPKIDRIRGSLRYLEHVLVAGGSAAGEDCLKTALAAAEPRLAAVETSKDDMAFWLYSSGTTGFPKGAIHLHHDMIVEADLYAEKTIGLREDDLSFSVARLFFAYGLGNGLYFPLRLGGTTVLYSDRPTPEAVFGVIDRYRPTVFYGVPTSYAAMLHLAETTGRSSLGRVRMCVSAGEPLPSHLFEKWLERFGVEILDGIGSTEILHIFISNRPGRARAGSTGQIVPGYEAKIVDDNGNEVPQRTVGTLLIKGDSIAAGYWNKHEQTKETFRGEWINTHDKFLVDEDGFYWYAGRTDDMMKVSGQAVWPTDVEAILLKHPAVLESGVVGVADKDGLIKPCAYVVLKDSFKPSAELEKEIQAFVKKTTAPHKYPRAVVFVEELPKTATGKIQRYKLREIAATETPLHR